MNTNQHEYAHLDAKDEAYLVSEEYLAACKEQKFADRVKDEESAVQDAWGELLIDNPDIMTDLKAALLDQENADTADLGKRVLAAMSEWLHYEDD